MLPTVVAIHSHEVTSALVLIVALLAAGLAVVGVQGFRRSKNPALRFVVAAFVVFGVRALGTAWALYFEVVKHEDLELVLAASDVLILGLLVAPLVLQRRRSAP